MILRDAAGLGEGGSDIILRNMSIVSCVRGWQIELDSY